jgi:hypothetical protein
MTENNSKNEGQTMKILSVSDFTQLGTVIQGWYIDFVGSNGRRCWCIKVKALSHREGYRDTWGVNDNTFASVPPEQIMGHFGLSREEYDKLNAERLALELYEKPLNSKK